MTLLLTMLTIQVLLGGLDNLVHHELTEKLPTRGSARTELVLHDARELIYALLFATLAWFAPHGLWAWVMLALLATEIIATLAAFIEEDRTRTLPPFERVLHTVLALNFGAILAIGAPLWLGWSAAPTTLAFAPQGLFSLFLTASRARRQRLGRAGCCCIGLTFRQSDAGDCVFAGVDRTHRADHRRNWFSRRSAGAPTARVG